MKNRGPVRLLLFLDSFVFIKRHDTAISRVYHNLVSDSCNWQGLSVRAPKGRMRVMAL